ncbi:MAG: DUF2784 family protein [Nocardioidaceae bacterium]
MWTVVVGGVVVVHLAYLLYALLGGLLAFRDIRWLPPHVVSMTWGVVVVAMQWRCPLTRLEKWMWVQSGETPYSGSFVNHYVYGTFLPEGSQAATFTLQLLFIFSVYAVVLRRRLQPTEEPPVVHP